MARVELRMRTFLPYLHVASPVNSNERFLGDPRQAPIWSSSAYRTSQSWIVDTSKPTKFIESAGKNTGWTIREKYENGKWTVNGTKKALTSDLTYTAYYQNGDVYINCKCSSSNPLVPRSPAIDYQFTIKVSNAGSVKITGKHDGFPSYELMRKNYTRGTAPETVYFFKPNSVKDIYKLFPDMDVTVNKSLTVK